MAYLMDDSGRQELANRLNAAMLGKGCDMFIKGSVNTHSSFV